VCGIAGTLALDGDGPSRELLRRMTAAIAHRGPDGDGYYLDGPAGLGHCRLAVIDLSSAGRQPMVTPDGRFALSYNGEVYNFAALRAELQSKGHAFRSRTDSEVVLHAWAEWGPAALCRLNGMFALALWDRAEQAVYLARDRYGIKPLYHARAGGTFVFGSEVKALLAHPALAAELDPEGLLEYLTFQNFFTQRTLFAKVRLVPAGAIVRVDRQGDESLSQYWDYAFQEPEEKRPVEEYAEELDRLFHQAVSRQLVSDVPVGAYLSGGMDSGSITAVATGLVENLRTFTIGFDLTSASGLELGFDERAAAEHMSYLFHTEQYEMVLKAGDMERVMTRMAWHLEEPRVGQSYPNFYAAQLASKFGKVVLSGAGGDEIFGGYPWRYYRAVVNADFDEYIEKYLRFWQRLVPAEVMPRLLEPLWNRVGTVDIRDIFRGVFLRHASSLTRPEDYINHSLYFEAKTFLHGLLVVEDKLSMAHGLETRLPFLDNDLVDFAMRVPVGLKLGNLGAVVRLNENEPGPKTVRYFNKTRDGKLLLRQVMRRYVPPEVADGEKRGFAAPDASWFRGESIDYVRSLLLRPNARIYDFLDRDTARELILDHLEERENRRLLIWSLLSLEHWCEGFLGGDGFGDGNGHRGWPPKG